MGNFDSRGEIRYFGEKKLDDREVKKIVPGQRFRARVDSDYKLFLTKESISGAMWVREMDFTIVWVYPHWCRCVDENGHYCSFDLGDLVRLGLEPANPGYVMESEYQEYDRRSYSPRTLKKIKKQLKGD